MFDPPETSARVAALERRVAELERENADLRRAKDDLDQRQRDLAAIVENTPSPIYVKDAEGRYVHVNPCFERYAGVPLAVIRGRTDPDLFPPAVADLFGEQDRQVMRVGHAQEFEETIPLPGGQHSFITVKFPLKDAAGRVSAVAGFCTDITARKRDELEREALIADLQRALDELATLRGILPICAWCKQIRDDQGYWSQLDAYLSRHAPVAFSHGICPACEDKVMRDEYGRDAGCSACDHEVRPGTR